MIGCLVILEDDFEENQHKDLLYMSENHLSAKPGIPHSHQGGRGGGGRLGPTCLNCSWQLLADWFWTLFRPSVYRQRPGLISTHPSSQTQTLPAASNKHRSHTNTHTRRAANPSMLQEVGWEGEQGSSCPCTQAETLISLHPRSFIYMVRKININIVQTRFGIRSTGGSDTVI